MTEHQRWDWNRSILPVDLLTGSTALVTGASSGIGRAIVEGLGMAGANVVAVARRADRLQELPRRISGTDILSLVQDVGDVDSIPSWVEEAWEWQDGLDLLVNCAGTTSRVGELEVTPAEWDDVLAVNLRAPFFISREVARRMLGDRGGSIVNIASISGVVSDGARAAYSASKAGLIRMSAVLADAWAPHIRVNAISPGWVETEMTEQYLAEPANRSEVIARTKLGRVGSPSEVVGAVIYLGSDLSSFVTGQNLIIDGGWTC